MSFTLGLFLSALTADPGVATALRSLQAQDQRVASIAFVLATRNVGVCARRKPWPGFLLHEPGQYAPAAREAAERVFGFSGHPTVLAVVPESPAAKAGLKRDDRIISINDKPVAASNTRRADYDRLAEIKEQLASALARGSVTLLTNQGKRQIAAINGCQSDVEIVPGRKLNAHADGEIVQLSSAVVDEARDDDELAFVIAHELAHNIMEHPQKLERGKRSTARIRETEVEADRMALSLMKRAGFDYHAAARFWTRFGAKTGFGIFSDGTHMRTRQRVAFLEQVATSLDRGSARN
jgi:hypothetical protein